MGMDSERIGKDPEVFTEENVRRIPFLQTPDGKRVFDNPLGIAGVLQIANDSMFRKFVKQHCEIISLGGPKAMSDYLAGEIVNRAGEVVVGISNDQVLNVVTAAREVVLGYTAFNPPAA